MTRLEIAATVAIGGLLVWFSGLGSVVLVDADFELIFHRCGDSPNRVVQRIAMVPIHEATIRQLFHQGLIWRDIPDDENLVSMKFDFSYRMKQGVCLSCRVPDVARRALLVEYASADQTARYRLIPFEIPIARQRVVSLTIPREPPSDDEAWKPQ